MSGAEVMRIPARNGPAAFAKLPAWAEQRGSVTWESVDRLWRAKLKKTASFWLELWEPQFAFGVEQARPACSEENSQRSPLRASNGFRCARVFEEALMRNQIDMN